MKKVLLWWPNLEPRLITALQQINYEIVGAIQSNCDAIRCFPIADLIEPRPISGPCYCPESQALFNTVFGRYFRNISRVQVVFPASARLAPEFGTFEASTYRYDEACNLFFLHYRRLVDLLEELDVDAVWFCCAPHLGIDNLLFELCKSRNIETLVFQQSIFPDRFFYGTSTESLFTDDGALLLDNPITLSDVGRPNLFYMRGKRRHSLFSQIWKRLRSSVSSGAMLAYLCEKSAHGLSERGYAFSAALVHYGFHRSLSRLFTELENAYRSREYRATQRKIDKSSDAFPPQFVYFALHLQPELTTSELGGIYQDQCNAIEALQQILPSGWKILIKENPKQNYFYRGPSFYERLALNPAVRFVPGTTPSSRLIQEAELTATITGTVGYEALVSGKPVLVFGDAWYKNITGAHIFDWNLDLTQLAETDVDRDQVRRELHGMQRRCASGVVYGPYTALSTQTDDELACCTARSIAEIDNALHQSGDQSEEHPELIESR